MFCAFRRGTAKLGMAKVTQVDFPPRETVSYSKETQTPTMTHQKEGDPRFYSTQVEAKRTVLAVRLKNKHRVHDPAPDVNNKYQI